MENTNNIIITPIEDTLSVVGGMLTPPGGTDKYIMSTKYLHWGVSSSSIDDFEIENTYDLINFILGLESRIKKLEGEVTYKLTIVGNASCNDTSISANGKTIVVYPNTGYYIKTDTDLSKIILVDGQCNIKLVDSKLSELKLKLSDVQGNISITPNTFPQTITEILLSPLPTDGTQKHKFTHPSSGSKQLKANCQPATSEGQCTVINWVSDLVWEFENNGQNARYFSLTNHNNGTVTVYGRNTTATNKEIKLSCYSQTNPHISTHLYFEVPAAQCTASFDSEQIRLSSATGQEIITVNSDTDAYEDSINKYNWNIEDGAHIYINGQNLSSAETTTPSITIVGNNITEEDKEIKLTCKVTSKCSLFAESEITIIVPAAGASVSIDGEDYINAQIQNQEYNAVTNTSNNDSIKNITWRIEGDNSNLVEFETINEGKKCIIGNKNCYNTDKSVNLICKIETTNGLEAEETKPITLKAGKIVNFELSGAETCQPGNTTTITATSVCTGYASGDPTYEWDVVENKDNCEIVKDGDTLQFRGINNSTELDVNVKIKCTVTYNSTDESKKFSKSTYKDITVNHQTLMYYWYAGWTEPSAQNISSIVDETYPVSSTITTMNKAGGSTIVITGYTKENPLYFYDNNRFNPGRKQFYLVLPNGIGVYDSEGEASLLDTFILQENIVIPHHKVYISESGSSNIRGLMLF